MTTSQHVLPPRLTVPPLPPRVHRRLHLTAEPDGLLLRPDDGDEGVLVRWGTKGKVEPWGSSRATSAVTIGGILGMVRLWDAAYLLIFLPSSNPFPLFPSHLDSESSGRKAAASVHHVYSLRDVHSVPLIPELANKTIARLAELEAKHKQPTPAAPPIDRELDASPPEADETPPTSVKEARKRFSLGWGRFKPKSPDSAPFASDPPQRQELEAKILKQIIAEFTSGGFFYSHDFDLTHCLQHKRRLLISRTASSAALTDLLDQAGSTSPVSSSQFQPIRPTLPSDDFTEPDIHIPLWRRVDRRFFWNEWLMKDFIDLGLHDYVVPVMQGWVQAASFTILIPPNPLEPGMSLGSVPVDLVVISRRSRDRAGLRYQRRGIDDEGHVANMVETEMMVRAKVEGKVSLFSFVQVRGSIPLKWSQSPYSMKPPPVLDQPVEKSYSVANLHFDDLLRRYGPITIINLSEQNGREAPVTNGYRDLVQSLGRKDISYKGFDFHAKCHGMRWENIAELVKELDFNGMGYLWTLQAEVIREQTGAFRTNCIDCLDRTNVVQSALARHVLATMLTQLGLTLEDSSVEGVFNDLWANNGDMLSLCYAHTSALKGDFVRTGKRDIQGMLHDGVSSISRMFYGAVSDFFAQAVISFFLGHRNLGAFSEFLEHLQSSDASSLIQLSRVRAAAIETSSARVLSDGEIRVAGWTLLSPEERNVRLTAKLEEKVLLLTKVAIYVVSFNYPLEKVIGFTRIPLSSITLIEKGAYILSTLQEAGRDPTENAGFALHFSPADESTRYSTYSLRNNVPPPGTPELDVEHANITASTEFYAFKVLPREFSTDDDESQAAESCRVLVDQAVDRIQNQIGSVKVVVKDVVSLSEAEQATSLFARVDYAFKRFLWL